MLTLPKLRSTKAIPSPAIKLKPIASSPTRKNTVVAFHHHPTRKQKHTSASYQVLGDLEDRIGRSATHDEVAKNWRKLRKVTRGQKREGCARFTGGKFGKVANGLAMMGSGSQTITCTMSSPKAWLHAARWKISVCQAPPSVVLEHWCSLSRTPGWVTTS